MIPNVLHYIYGMIPHFGGKPFSLIHYLCIKSACDVNQPDAVNLWYAYEPQGEWWNKVKPLVTLHKVKPLKEIFGKPLMHHAHRTDALRLQILLEHGGIYMDVDVICKKPFGDLRQHEFVIGQEGENGSYGLCNGVLMAQKGAMFAQKWLDGFVNFRSKGSDEYWNEFAVKYPAKIAPECAGHLHIEHYKSFHWPLWEIGHLKRLFESEEDFPEAYCHHLWESVAWEPYLKQLSVESIQNGTSYFHKLARRFL